MSLFRSLITSTGDGGFANRHDAPPQNGSTYVWCGGIRGNNRETSIPLPPNQAMGERSLRTTLLRCGAVSAVEIPSHGVSNIGFFVGLANKTTYLSNA